MKKGLKYKALSCLLLLHSKSSFSAYIASYYDFDKNSASLVNIDDGTIELPGIPQGEGQVSYGVTNDPVSGKLYSINENLDQSLELYSTCLNEETSITISPSNTVLDCLTSGPAGIYSLDTFGNIGKINANNGRFRTILDETLPGPFTSFVIAQDDDGTIHYINGDGKYYTIDTEAETISRVSGVTFPITTLSYCGEFTEDNIITAVSFSNPPTDQSIVKYDIVNQVVTTETVSLATNLLDVTGGPISDECTLMPSLMPSKAPKGSKKGSKSGGKKSKGASKSSKKGSKVSKGGKKSSMVNMITNYAPDNITIFDGSDLTFNTTKALNLTYYDGESEQNNVPNGTGYFMANAV